MSQTYQICEVTVTLPSLGTITTDGPGNQIKHGDKFRVHLYAVKPDWCCGGIFEGFIVGWFTCHGYSEAPYKRSQKIMMPDGFKLVALSVDEYGIPTSWDSLPVHFTGGYLGETSGKLYSAGIGISIEGDQRKVVFEADRFKGYEAAQSAIENAVVLSMKVKTALSDEMKQAVIDAVRESDLFTSLQAASTSDLQQAVNDALGDAIRNAMSPGGAIWVAISHR